MSWLEWEIGWIGIGSGIILDDVLLLIEFDEVIKSSLSTVTSYWERGIIGAVIVIPSSTCSWDEGFGGIRERLLFQNFLSGLFFVCNDNIPKSKFIIDFII